MFGMDFAMEKLLAGEAAARYVVSEIPGWKNHALRVLGYRLILSRPVRT